MTALPPLDPRRIRRDILTISHASGHGHLPTCFSVVEALCAIHGVMRHDPANPAWPERDLFVLSKGHAALGLYTVLAGLGYFSLEEVFTFGGHGSRFGCHADRRKVPGVEASTGSLGHGIGLAVGMALGLRSAGRGDRRVFTLIGDGESNEGTVWEAVMVAANLGLDNLAIVYDDNGSQGRCLPLADPGARFRAFGCEVEEVDGHDMEALRTALTRRGTGPRVVVSRARKGWGCRTFIDEMYAWHRRSPTDDELPRLLEDVDAWPVQGHGD